MCICTLFCKGQSSFFQGGGYGGTTNDNSLYWSATGAFSIVSGATTYFNIKKLHSYDKYRSNAIFGGLWGCAQTALGIAYIRAPHPNQYIPASINIGFGLTTLTTSIIRLATKNPPKEGKVTFNLMYLPPINHNNAVVRLHFSKTF